MSVRKLTNEEARAVYKLQQMIGNIDIVGRRFGIGQCAVRRIMRGETYAEATADLRKEGEEMAKFLKRRL